MSTELAWQLADFSLPMQRAFSQVEVLGIQPSGTKYNLLSFLACAQALKVPILSKTWQSTQKAVRTGGTSRIEEAQVNASTNIVFKRIKESEKHEKSEAEIFQMLTTEIVVLAHERIRAHENIVQLQGIGWDISLDRKAWPVLIFEKSPLGDLSDFMASQKGRALSIHQRAELGLDIADAVVDMHSINIVHGDLKPENVLVYKHYGGFGYPDCVRYSARVTDFGYSTCYSEDNHLITLPISRPWNAPEHTRLNRQWTPEEAKNTDLFSAGLLFLWLLFEGKILQATSLAEIEYPESRREPSWSDQQRTREHTLETLLKYKNDNALPALAQQLLQAEGKLQDNEKFNLEDFFNSVLSNIPNERDALSAKLPVVGRHTNIDSLASEADFKIETSITELYRCHFRVRSYIVRCLEDSLSLAQELGDEETARKVAYQLALCCEIGFGYERNEARSMRILNEFGYQKVELMLLKAKNPEFLHDSEWLMVQQIPDGDVEESDTEEAISHLSQEARDLAIVLGNEHTLTLNISGQLLNLLAMKGRYNEVEKLSRQTMEISNKVFGPKGVHTAGSMSYLALTYLHNGRLDEAEKLMVQVIEFLGQVPSDTSTRLEKPRSQNSVDHVDLIEKLQSHSNQGLVPSLLRLGEIYRTQERWQEAENLQFGTFQIAVNIFGADHPETLKSMLELASTYYSTNRLNEAEQLFLQVLESIPEVRSAEHPERLKVDAELAFIYSAQGHHEKASRQGLQALNARLKLFGPAHPDTLESMTYMTITFGRAQQWEKAEETCMQLIELTRQTFGAEHAFTLNAMKQLMKIYFDQERWAQAEKIALQTVDARRKLLGAENIATIDDTSDLANIYTKQGRWKEAEDLHKHVIEIRKQLLGIEHHNTLACMGDLVVLYILYRPERLADAEQLALQIMTTSIKTLGSSNPDTLTSMENLAEVYQKQGRQDEASSLLESVQRLQSEKADHGDASLHSEKISRSRNDSSSVAKSKGSPRSKLPSHRSSSRVEKVKRARDFSRRARRALVEDDMLPDSMPSI